MKKLIALLLSIAILITLSACGTKKELDPAAFTKEVIETVSYDDDMISLGEGAAEEYYDLTIEGLESWAAYSSGTRATSNELMVMKLKDSTAMEAAKKSVQGRLEDLTADYEDYRPEELFRLENAIIDTEGNYLLFSVSPDNDAVKNLFEQALK